MSVSHALALAESVRRKLQCPASDPANRATTQAEIDEGEAEKAKAVAALASSIVVVDKTLAALRKGREKTLTSEKETRVPNNALKLSRPEAANASNTLRTRASPTANDPALESVREAMSAEGLKPGVDSLKDMANAIEPIIDKFDEVLRQPYLKNYNATLNTVPVVGLKGTDIMYIETKADVLSGAGIGYQWSLFSALPSDATVTPTTKVHMFPYKGDFYLSVGASVWKKAHISERDPAIRDAVNNWPALYVKEWTHVGSSVLPASDLAGVVPFALLNPDRTELSFHLVTLAADGSLSYLTNDTIAPGNKYEPFEFKGSSGSTPPKWTKVAYWDGHLVGIDSSSKSWNIAPKFPDGTYTISDESPIDPVTEFTATEAGLVGLRSDGFLWRRLVEAPPPGSDEDASLKWAKWIKADGVTNLGVASPGVLLDMNLLTNTLRTRYIDVQTSVYPVVDRLRAFGLTHVFWLDAVAKDADAWLNASTPEQQALAIKNAKSFVTHSQTWSKIVSSSISGAKDSVNIMAAQLKDVRNQLQEQLQLLRDKLVGLKATLDAQNEAMTKLKAAFWGTIAATLFGVALVIVGIVTANPLIVVGGGILFVGGLVATIALAVQISELAASIANTEAQIRDVNTAIAQLEVVVDSFTDLDNLYGVLNTFWGRMANDASAIKSMDEATAIQIGAEILADTSSIEAARFMTQQLAEACQTYLDVLNKQGIKIPEKFTLGSAAEPRSNADEVDRLLAEASRALRDDKIALYQAYMTNATLANMRHLSDVQKATVASGLWFDVPALNSSASIWQGGRAFSSGVGLSSELRASLGSITGAISVIIGAADSLDGSLSEVRPYVQQMLTDIISLGETIQGWIKKFPALPTDPQGKAEFEKLQNTAISTCSNAQNKARLANNTFADFTNEAREYQQGLDRSITEKSDAITSEKRRADAELDNLSPPWYVYLGGWIAVVAWMETEKASIKNRLASAINSLNASISQFEQMKNSGYTFEGNANTWIEMSQTISGNLGTIYNIMTGVWGQLIEDPILYRDFLSTEWDDVVKNARDVLQILNSNSSTRSTSISLSRATPLALTNAPETDKEIVLGALSPNAALAPVIGSQAESATNVFSSFDKLIVSPYLKDIVGYWAEADTERKTLFDVVTALRTEYVQMVATEYDTIQNLSSLAILQEFRANNVAEGKLSLTNFVQFTAQSVRIALQAAQKTSNKFGGSAEQFQFVLSVIDNNIKNITEKIDGLTTDIENASAALRDKILWVIADTIALAFAAAAVLVAFGVVGPVGAALTLAAQIGATAGATASAIKLVLDSLGLADIVQTIEGLKATRNALSTSIDELKAVRPLFGDVVNGVNGLTTHITGMYDTLEQVLSQIELVGEISFTREDALKVKEAWSDVGNDAQAWMDVINAQGISPITFSIDNKAH
ncbi:hypothetical protein PHLGIDRAFT_129960 [Phlebiopsis gigantea 11061_1 CR5-6]|uniref:Uncharacterized protein n=1 Tax=Phlebiopsis gigantea (strain 11061_1 CR5-6) TaxID=745531 RepID=A0A0C3S5U5_PHLG1|nr:hypothetical protein PHLGIDRAFT_129960 [Phlebiopsis gigantea 11061_1 CR5-6]